MIITSHPRLVLDRICVTHIPPPSSSSFSPLSPGTTIDYQNNKKTVENKGRGKKILENWSWISNKNQGEGEKILNKSVSKTTTTMWGRRVSQTSSEWIWRCFRFHGDCIGDVAHDNVVTPSAVEKNITPMLELIGLGTYDAGLFWGWRFTRGQRAILRWQCHDHGGGSLPCARCRSRS